MADLTDPLASKEFFYEDINLDLKGKGNPDLPYVCSKYWPPIMALSLSFDPAVKIHDKTKKILI